MTYSFKKFKRYIIYCLIRFLINIFKQIPLSQAYKITDFLSLILIQLIKKEKKIIITNLNHVELPLNKKRFIKSNIKNLAKIFAEFIKFSYLPIKKWEPFFKVKGEDILQQEIKKGKGVILLTGHLGNWELAGGYLGKKGYKVNAIYRKPVSEYNDNIIRHLRKLNKINLIDNSDALSGSIKCLKNGELLFILSDQYPKSDGINIPFLGKEAPTPKGIGIFAIKTGASIVSAFVIRKENGFILEFKKLEYKKEGKISQKVKNILICINNEYSRIISRYPEQWAWIHNRWGLKVK